MNRRKTLGIVAVSALTTVGLALSAIIFSNSVKPSALSHAGSYTLTLNSSNGISGTNVTKTESKTTDSGQYQVDFNYNSCSALSGGHATILAGGSIVNKDHIRSIYQVVANFSTSGELKFRASYDGATWGGYTSMTSELPYTLGSNPYYLEFSTDGTNAVNVSSIQFSYTCLENEAAQGTEIPGSTYYQLCTSSSDLVIGDEYVITNVTNGSGMALTDTVMSSYYLAGESITVSDSKFTIGTSSSICPVILGGSSGAYTLSSSKNPTKSLHDGGTYQNLSFQTSGSTWSIDLDNHNIYSSTPHYIYYRTDKSNFTSYQYGSSYTTCIYHKVVESAGTQYDIPVDETGFTATDSNQNSYSTNSIFDNDNNLVVKATFTDGSSKVLTSGTYSYVVKNSSGVAIDTSAKFPAAGEYTLTVSYGSYIPVVINLNVGEYTYLTGITTRLTNTTFNTADVLSNTIGSILEVDLAYNISSANKTIYYSSLSENNLTIALLDPNGVSQALTSAFGVAGNWKVKVSSVSDPSIYGEASLTVNAIQVTNITLNNTELVLHPNETAQLLVTFTPANATNQNVTWTSDNSAIASVDENGLVTAHAVGGPVTITATSADGAKTATCLITVKKVATTTGTIVVNYSGTTGTTNIASSIDKNDFNTTDITLSNATGSGYVCASSSSQFRFGSGSSTGGLTFTLSEASVITGVSVNVASYGSDSNPNIKISTSANTTGETIAITSSTADDYVATAFSTDTSESTTVTVSTTASSKRVYFNSITLTLGVVDPVYPTAITLSNQTINVGETVLLTPSFTPSDTNQTSVVWSSTNTSVATVNSSGLVTGVAQGSATIKATGKDENDNDVVGSCTVTVNTVAVTGVTLSQTTADLGIGKTLTLTANVAPSNATNKNVTWSSNKTNIATVNSSGLVTGVAEGSATIKATTVDGSFQASCTVTVSAVALDDWTLLFYVCGSNLESDDGAARDDLKEILSVRSQQPDSVNIAVETGGSTSWKMSGVSASELGRFEINSSCSSTQMSKKQSVTNASMGASSTLQSFLEWGIQNYPAQKYGLFMWNHGGAMDGCCFDDNFDGDGLYTNEVDAAVTAAKSTCGISNKLEFIAYDACLMAVQDIAEFNSHNFNYMISSQETEWSGGYDYDAWLPTLYNNPSTVTTPTLLTKVGETFMDYYENAGYYDQTQAVYDLSKMAAYKSAWEDMTTSLTSIVNSSSKWTTFTGYINQALKYGYSSDASSYNNGYPYDVFDVNGAITKLQSASAYSSLSSKFSAILTALNNVVIYNRYGSNNAVNGSCGMNLFCPISGYNQINGATWSGTYYEANYDSTRTNFTKWQAFVAQYGNWAA